jgi:hypothetical protein
MSDITRRVNMDNPNKSPWVQGYIDALNNTINIHAYETDKDYEDGYETAAAAEIKYVEQFMKGESNDF